MGMNPDNAPFTKDDLKQTQRDLEECIVRESAKIHAALDNFEKSFLEDMRAMESEIAKRFDRFRWVRKSDHAKIIADWRAAQFEKLPSRPS